MTVLLIHGFTDSSQGTHLNQVKDELLKANFDVNVIMVDWAGGAAGPDYYQAHSNVQTVGEITARFIYSTRINPMQVHCIGHSLGAHACGYVGRNVKLGRISGLDPAGPLFDDNNRLRDTDAEFKMGHKDFYPNGGKVQNGCQSLFSKPQLLNDNGTVPGSLINREHRTRRNSRHFSLNPIKILSCSHTRSVAYFAESINAAQCMYTAVPCSSYDDYRQNRCMCGGQFFPPCARMGFYSNTTAQNGIFYLTTNSAEPYCMSSFSNNQYYLFRHKN